MRKFIIILGMAIWTLSSFSTIFVPIPLEHQLKEANGVIHGIFLGSVYKKLPNGEVVTEHTFKLINRAGISAGQIINEHNFKVLSPGGTWQGLVYHVEGSPTFDKGEEVILLLQKGKYGMEVYGLGMGKYKIKREDRETIIYSTIFPSHKKLGKIRVRDFNLALKKVYGESLQRLGGRHYVYQKESPRREVATAKIEKKPGGNLGSLPIEKEETNGTSAPLGGILFLVLMAVGIVYFLNKR